MGWGQPRRDAHPGGRRIAPHRCGCPFGCTPPLAPDGAKDSVPPKGQPQKQDSGRCGNRVTNLNQDLTKKAGREEQEDGEERRSR
jgi:hypothetical protein